MGGHWCGAAVFMPLGYADEADRKQVCGQRSVARGPISETSRRGPMSVRQAVEKVQAVRVVVNEKTDAGLGRSLDIARSEAWPLNLNAA
jgi:hypothetical protein